MVTRVTLEAMRFALVLVALCTTSAPAIADTAAELQAKGEALAKERLYTDAIAKFKAADKLEPNATHICLIALAYTRRELWPQAEVFLARCHVLAVGGERPAWLPEVDALIADRVAHASVAEVEVVIDPPNTPADLSVSSFLPDETFTPSTKIHLPPGHHVITASAAGFERESVGVDITDQRPKRVTIHLYRSGTRPEPPKPLSHYLFLGGITTLGAGAVAYGVMGVGWLALHDRSKDNFGGTYQHMYELARPVSLSLLSVGAALVIGGLFTRQASETSTTATVTPLPGGAMIAVGWSR